MYSHFASRKSRLRFYPFPWDLIKRYFVLNQAWPAISSGQRPLAPVRIPNESPAPARPVIEYDLSDMSPWREFAVILYNDDVHSADEVVVQIIKALGCPFPRAHELMLKAHESGQATVAIAGREQALKIASVLKQIDLHVSIRQIN